MISPSTISFQQQGTAIIKSGFKTKIHALEHCPTCQRNHKEEIDRNIIEHRWSNRFISTELKKRFPQCPTPSDRAIDNYRKHYLPYEPGRVSNSKLTDEIIAQVKSSFDVIFEGIRQYHELDKRVQKAIAAEHRTGQWSHLEGTDKLFVMRFTMWKDLSQKFQDLGLPKDVIPTVAEEVKVQINNGQHDPTKIQSIVVGILRGVDQARDADRRGIPSSLPADYREVEGTSPPEP